jgi:hypothetical protein
VAHVDGLVPLADGLDAFADTVADSQLQELLTRPDEADFATGLDAPTAASSRRRFPC